MSAELEALQARRDKIARELQEMEDDAAHWNRINPTEEPLVADDGRIAHYLDELDKKLAIIRAREQGKAR